MPENKFLFNFAVSYMSGGFKRLYAYADWFNQHGGAWFIVHPQCEYLIDEFPENQFFCVQQSKLTRLINDASYLKKIHSKISR